MTEEIQDFSFTKDLEAAEAVQARKNSLPRAVVRPTFYQLLDGAWGFAHDPEDVGLDGDWAAGHAYKHIVQWLAIGNTKPPLKSVYSPIKFTRPGA